MNSEDLIAYKIAYIVVDKKTEARISRWKGFGGREGSNPRPLQSTKAASNGRLDHFNCYPQRLETVDSGRNPIERHIILS